MATMHLLDEQNRLVEVVEPDPNGSGAVATGGMKTSYSYNTLGNLTLVTQGDQTRSFQYDALSRLTAQKLAERDATLNSSGVYVGAGQWSDVFSYDNRSNLIWRVEARGVKTVFNYNSDPLNRLQSVQYDTTGVPGSLLPNIPAAPTVTYAYLATGDKTRLQSVTMSNGMGNESFSYDVEGRMSQASQTFPGRESNPLLTNYLWDSLDRMERLTYPAQHSVGGARKEQLHVYDIASRVNNLKFDGVDFASNFNYNASSQVETLNVGSLMTETYSYDLKTGLLLTQQVKQGTTTRLDLKYNYTLNNDVNNNGAKTGQLTGITDLMNSSRNKAYVYDKLGRLKDAKSGSDAFNNPSWTQNYTYDRYGNRTGVTKSGPGAGSIPLDGLASLVYTNAQSQTVSNRITTAGYEYDPAGNQTRGQTENGTWRRYKYDSAGRLAVALDDSSNPQETYSYGASNERLLTVYGNGLGAPATYYCWEGGQVIADFRAGTSSNLVWEKSYVYLGGRLLATADISGTKYHHPDRLGTRLVTDGVTGQVTEQVNLPYGVELTGESSAGFNNRRFTSYDRSATTGMDYAVNRFYNSAQGRFNQVDPIGIKASSLDSPQSLNLYAYVGNDPVNMTDPDGLFWKAIGNFFKAIGKAFSAVAKAVLRILNNKWVSLGFTILGAMAGIGLFGEFAKLLNIPKMLGRKFVQTVSTAVAYYQKAKHLASFIAVAGDALQGKFKEIGLGLLGAIPAILEDSIQHGIMEAFKNSQSKSPLGLLKAGWKGFKDGLRDGLKRIKIIFTRPLKDLLVPVYGFFCGPGYGYDSSGHDTLNSKLPASAARDGQDSVCRRHDETYFSSKDNDIRAAADLRFFRESIFADVNGHLINGILGTNVGQSYRFVSATSIGLLGVGRKLR